LPAFGDMLVLFAIGVACFGIPLQAGFAVIRGARIIDLPLGELSEMPTINASGGFAPIEAYAWHKPLLERRGGEYDPRVRTRIERAMRGAGLDVFSREPVSPDDPLLELSTLGCNAASRLAHDRDARAQPGSDRREQPSLAHR
jgi:hypothetical protein